MKSFIPCLLILLLVGCAKSSGGRSPAPPPVPETDKKTHAATALNVYDGETPNDNVIQAENLKQGEVDFDFTYKPDLDGSIAITSMKPYLIGCQESDVEIEFNLFYLGPDGKTDHTELGPAPALDGEPPSLTPVKAGVQYVLRGSLMLEKPCLGLAFHFAVKEFL